MQAARGASLNPSDPAAIPATLKPSRTPLLIAVALVAWAIDLGTKVLAVEKLSGRDSVHLVGDLLQLTLTRNPGAAFSTGTSYTMALSLVAVAAVLSIVYFARRVRDVVWAFALGLLLAGVAGNLTDRIFRAPSPLKGHVVDFLELPNWPIFNIADICINIAAALILIQAFRGIKLDGTKSESPEK